MAERSCKGYHACHKNKVPIGTIMTAYEINLNRHRHSYIHTLPNLWCLQMIPFGLRYLVLHMTRPYSLPNFHCPHFPHFPGLQHHQSSHREIESFPRAFHWCRREARESLNPTETVIDKRKSFESFRKAQWKKLKKRMKFYNFNDFKKLAFH